MSRAEARLLLASNLLVGGTGLVYGWMRYLAEPDDPYAIVNHPWQPELQHLHVLLAPLLVFACGILWSSHAWHRFRSGERQNRRTGVALFLVLLPMIVSGYAIQVAMDETWRTVWIVVHVAASLLWLAACVAHDLRGRSEALR